MAHSILEISKWKGNITKISQYDRKIIDKNYECALAEFNQAFIDKYLEKLPDSVTKLSSFLRDMCLQSEEITNQKDKAAEHLGRSIKYI